MTENNGATPETDRFDPSLVRIERRRPSVTQGDALVSYDGTVITVFGDEIKLTGGTGPHAIAGWEGEPDEVFVEAARIWHGLIRRARAAGRLRADEVWLHDGWRKAPAQCTIAAGLLREQPGWGWNAINILTAWTEAYRARSRMHEDAALALPEDAGEADRRRHEGHRGCGGGGRGREA